MSNNIVQKLMAVDFIDSLLNDCTIYYNLIIAILIY